MTPMHYADALYAKSCKVADIYDELTLNDIFIKSFDSSLCHSLQEYRVLNPQADRTDIAFSAQLLLGT